MILPVSIVGLRRGVASGLEAWGVHRCSPAWSDLFPGWERPRRMSSRNKKVLLGNGTSDGGTVDAPRALYEQVAILRDAYSLLNKGASLPGTCRGHLPFYWFSAETSKD